MASIPKGGSVAGNLSPLVEVIARPTSAAWPSRVCAAACRPAGIGEVGTGTHISTTGTY